MKMTRVPIHGGLSWQVFTEQTASTDDSSFTMTGLLEQLNTTRDLTDYLWYSTEWVINSSSIFKWQLLSFISVFWCLIVILLRFFASVVIDPNEGFLRSGNDPVLTVLSAGHALHVFVNGQLSGEEHNVFSALLELFKIFNLYNCTFSC
jgi:hypothetical protein